MRKIWGKKGVVADYLPWIIIAVIFLTLMLISIFFQKEGSVTLVDRIKGIFVGRA